MLLAIEPWCQSVGAQQVEDVTVEADAVVQDQATQAVPVSGPAPRVPVPAAPATAPAATQPATTTRPADDPAEKLPTTRPSRLAPAPAPAELDAARRQIWKQFRADYDKAEDADRSALGHRLLRQALESQTGDVSRFALLCEARDLAIDALDEPLAMKCVEALAFYFEIDVPSEKLKVLSGARWPAEADEDAGRLVNDWLVLSDLALARDRFDIAAIACERAAGLARGWGEESSIARVDAQSRGIDDRRIEHERVESARKTLASRPQDPGANLVLGAHAAAVGDWAGALPRLKLANDPLIRTAATRDLAEPNEPGSQINLGDDWLGAASDQAPAAAEAFQRRARHWYLRALPKLNLADKKQVLQRLRDLPGGNIFEALSDDISSPRRLNPLGGGGGAAFDDTPPKGAMLVGVRITVGPVYGNPCITSVQPMFRGESGAFEGAAHGKVTGKIMTAEARDGYAVGALVLKTGWAVDGFKVVFMRIKANALDPKDRYESDWFGGRGGGAETTLGGDGKPMIGLHGRSGDGIDALGAVQTPR